MRRRKIGKKRKRDWKKIGKMEIVRRERKNIEKIIRRLRDERMKNDEEEEKKIGC